MKKQIILIKYYSKKLLKNLVSSYLALFLFSLSFILFFSLIIPRFSNRLPFFNHWYKIYQLKGSIVSDTTFKGSVVSAEVGPFKSEIQKDNSFEITFPSKNIDSIPIVFTVMRNKQSFEIRKIGLNELNKQNNFRFSER